MNYVQLNDEQHSRRSGHVALCLFFRIRSIEISSAVAVFPFPDLEYGDVIPIAGSDRIAQPAVEPGVPGEAPIGAIITGASFGSFRRNQMRVDRVRGGRGADDDRLVVVEMALGGTLGSHSGLKLKRMDAPLQPNL